MSQRRLFRSKAGGGLPDEQADETRKEDTLSAQRPESARWSVTIAYAAHLRWVQYCVASVTSAAWRRVGSGAWCEILDGGPGSRIQFGEACRGRRGEADKLLTKKHFWKHEEGAGSGPRVVIYCTIDPAS